MQVSTERKERNIGGFRDAECESAMPGGIGVLRLVRGKGYGGFTIWPSRNVRLVRGILISET